MGGAKVHLHALGFGPRLVAELDQGHQHGQAKAANQDVEDPGDVGQAQSLRRLVLESGRGDVFGGEKSGSRRGSRRRWMTGVGENKGGG